MLGEKLQGMGVKAILPNEGGNQLLEEAEDSSLYTNKVKAGYRRPATIGQPSVDSLVPIGPGVWIRLG